MGRISATVSGMEQRLLRRFAEATASASLAGLRVATGHKILSAADNPSAFTSLAQLRSDMSGVTATASNVAAASSLVSQAQLAIDQIRTQLETIRGKAAEDQNQALDADERVANQAAIDEAIDKIQQLAETMIGGRRLLDGSADFTITGANNSQISDISVHALGGAASRTIAGNVTTPGTQADLVHTEVGGTISADATIVVAGDRGQTAIELENGDTLAEAAEKINQQSNLTGVIASVAGNDLHLKSIDYGTAATVAVEVTAGTFVVTGDGGDGIDEGSNAVATIGGQSRTGTGNTFSVNDNGLQYRVTFKGGFSGAFSTVTVSGQALAFALSPSPSSMATLAIPGLQPARLGGLSGLISDLASGGSLSGLASNAPLAVRVADEALAKLTRVEGSVNGFADAAIESSSALLAGMQTNLQGAIDFYDKVDPAEEAQQIAENQLLASNALAGLSILNQQRQSVLSLILQIANLSTPRL